MQLSRIALLVSVALAAAGLSGCTTTAASRPRAKQERPRRPVYEAKAEARKDWTKANFSLHRRGDVDWRYIRRGKKAMGGPALDSY